MPTFCIPGNAVSCGKIRDQAGLVEKLWSIDLSYEDSKADRAHGEGEEAGYRGIF